CTELYWMLDWVLVVALIHATGFGLLAQGNSCQPPGVALQPAPRAILRMGVGAAYQQRAGASQCVPARQPASTTATTRCRAGVQCTLSLVRNSARGSGALAKAG